MTCGDTLESLLVSEPGPVLLAAPFIKAQIFERILQLIGPTRPVRVITRWRADEVAAGVSDLEVLDIALQRGETEIWLCNSLHAKYYRTGKRRLVGSANLTGRGLGWHHQPNLELLVSVESHSANFECFEETLLRASVPATVELQEMVRTAASALPRAEAEHGEGLHVPVSDWLPATRHPEQLFRAYRGDRGHLTGAAREQTSVDLGWLQPPMGLNEAQFRSTISAALLQAPLVASLLNFGGRPRRFGEVRDFLEQEFAQRGIDRSGTEAWQTCVRWLIHFMPNRVSLSKTNYSEIFQTRPLGSRQDLK